MTLLHADGFALYGTGATGRTNMLQGIYAEVDTHTPETTNPRAPGTHHLRLTGQNNFTRRVLGADKSAGCGVGYAFNPAALPSVNDNVVLLQSRDGANAAVCTVILQSTGVIEVKRGGATGTLLGSSAAVVTSNTYQHLEIFIRHANGSPLDGEVEIRRNGQTILNLQQVNTGSGTYEQYAIGCVSSATSPPTIDVADLHAWDTNGSINNSFLGDVVWYPVFPTADEAASDWVRNTGANDYETIDDTTPDADTTYIEAASGSPAAVSEFALGNVPAAASEIVAVVTQPMARKTDAGDGSLQVSLLSADIGSPAAPAESNGTDRPMTTTYTYYHDVHETDPATGVKWTPSGFNASRLRLTRTA